jgi:DnaJ family protein C protein 2
MKRLRKLVDNAYNSDTRIAKFMENDRQEKAAKKQAKQDAIRERKEAEEKEKRDAEEKLRKEKEEKEKIETERRWTEKIIGSKEMKRKKRK